MIVPFMLAVYFHCEYIPDKKEFTGRVTDRMMVYIADYAQKENYVVMAI